MSRPTSYGICALRGHRAPKAAMTRHLATCPASHQPTQGKAERLFRLRVEDTVTPWYWMDVEVRANATLEGLDDFLRHRWLECCGHLSAFYIDGATYMVPSYAAMPGDLVADPTERSMTVKLGEALSSGRRFQHVYDFGTSTELKLRVVDEREGRLGREPLRLLSANEAPDWGCALCDAAAESICTVCMYERNHPFYCRHHATDHACPEPETEMLLPVVNSPRMGMCAYTGPG